jgi:hypothetical protein
MNKATVPLIIIATGIGWLLSSNDIVPGVDWAIVLVMATVGALSMAGGLNRFSIVFGPIIMLASVLMVLMQSKKIQVEVALPVLIIALGLLMLISRFSKAPIGRENEPEEDN